MTAINHHGPDENRAGARLGTFLGVFTPSMLTILGVIMYLRFGWVVGNAGLANTLLIVLLANSITLITAFSISAVATNMRVEVGGAYYIISRSLGLEIGGAIGIPLYLSQTLSVTLYSFGFAEALRFVWPEAPLVPTAALTVVVVTLASIKSASLALKVQVPLLVLVGLSILSLAAGGDYGGRKPVMFGIFPDDTAGGFWGVFAVFFPAVTGIMAGVSMSGDLRDPQKSLPRGTIAAVLCGFGVYLLIPVILSLSATPDALREDPLIWTRIALVPFLVLPGLLCAILSSAMGSILGAPRTLQAMAGDHVTPRVLARTSRKGEPVPALVLSAALSLGAVLLGDLNAVAPVVTMFFLTTYGMVNLVAGLESLVKDPSFRPTVKVHWSVAFVGAVACFLVMFLISPWACAAAVVFELGVYFWLRRRSMAATWGDVRHGLLLTIIRTCLVALQALPAQARNWRPNILVFSGVAWKRVGLIRLASWLSLDRGIVTVCNLFVQEKEAADLDLAEHRAEIDRVIVHEGITAFSEVGVVRDFEEGVVDMVQANGIAGLSSNTVMLGWSEKRDLQVRILRILRKVARLGKSTLVCRIERFPRVPRHPEIVIWWGGKQRNGDMMLLLAHLLTLNPEWIHARITIKSVAFSESMREEILGSLDRMIPETRISARREVILKTDDRPIFDLIHEESRGADLVFMGLAVPEPGEESAYAERIDALIEGLPRVILVKNASPFSGQLV
jgi:potassium/chloride transporter 4/5/6